MDMAGKDISVEPHEGNEDPSVNCNPSNLSSNWQLNGANLTNTASIGMVSVGNSMVESSVCTSVAMVDSFCSPIWDQTINGQGLSYCDVNISNDASTSNSIGHGRVGGMNWAPNAMMRGPVFLPTLPGNLPQSLPQFPADSAFIERAARFSCFSGGSFGERMNPFNVPDPLNPYSRGLGPVQEVFCGSGTKSMAGIQSHRNEMSVTEVSKEEPKRGADGCSAESDEAEFSGRGGRDDTEGEPSGKGLVSKKRKRAGQASEQNENSDTHQQSVETAKNTSEFKQKGDENPSSTDKTGGKQGKQGSQGSDPPKEEYIHIRARRGQATNSHSLAERVRREKISERMKFLQDLVPGCSKVTGKALMLDEIINYVQSLQRQVEFLSMKLATVNPRLDFNIEGFLTKDLQILQPRTGMSSSMAFPPDLSMPFPQLHPPQSGLIQAGHLGTGTSSNALRRPINVQSTAFCGGFKEPTSQVPNVWEDELHNVVHMGFNSSSPLNNQDLSGSLPPGHMKSET